MTETKSRQTLARYAFFEQARQSNNYSGVADALLPLVLPGISGRANTIFSADTLSKELAPLFGTDLVTNSLNQWLSHSRGRGT